MTVSQTVARTAVRAASSPSPMLLLVVIAGAEGVVVDHTKAITQPMNVQPKSRFSSKIDDLFRRTRLYATKPGSK
jgi:hypothetical protein